MREYIKEKSALKYTTKYTTHAKSLAREREIPTTLKPTKP